MIKKYIIFIHPLKYFLKKSFQKNQINQTHMLLFLNLAVTVKQ